MVRVHHAVAVLAVLGAIGCNTGQPRTYRIAIDPSPLASLPPSCYRNNTVSTLRVIGTNLRSETQWVVWDGVENKMYLDTGGLSVTMGDAETVKVGSMIEGQDRVFSGQYVEQKLPDPGSQYTYTKTLSLIVTFDDMGPAPKGTIDASSQYTCTQCNNNDNKVNCAAKLNFVGRRVDTQYISGYSPQI
ncbi:MAG: hypothetical protein HYZ28_07750 [Myxococcales bacterium]|nr:hypothetical protein [Myxococcales bacterium]